MPPTNPYAAPERQVRSEPMQSGHAATRAPRNPGVRVGGLLLMLFGALLWIAGCRYTLEGWHYGLNWFAAWLGLPDQLPPIVGRGIFLALPLGVMYSLVELRRPWGYRARESDALALYWIIWTLIVLSDVGSTFLGVRQPGPGAALLAQQVAASPSASAVWALVLTFVPEWFMIGGTKLLRR